jgi:DNA polymerase III subunit delta
VGGVAQTIGPATEVHRFWLDEAGLESALLDLQSISLFGDQSITVLENAVALSTESKGKFDLSALEAYVTDPAPDRTLIVVVAAEKLDERRKIAKLLKKYPVVNCGVPPETTAISLLERIANDLGLQTVGDAMPELWRRVRSITAAYSELQKLKSFLDLNQPITKDDVQQLTVPAPEDNVFAWVDGVVHGRLQQSVEAIADLQHAGYDAFSLLAMLQRQLRLLWYAKVYGGRGMSPQDTAKLAGAHPYAMKVAMGQVRGLTTERIESLILTVSDAEYEIKRGKMDPGHALSWVMVACSGSTKQGTRAI